MTTLFDDALAHHQAGRLEQAEKAYRDLLRDQPAHPQGNNNLAILLRRQHRLDEAVTCYGRAIRANPADPLILNNLISVLVDLGRDDDALAVVRRVVTLSPDMAEGWFNLGNVLHKPGKAAAAKVAFHRAIRIRPTMAEAYCNLGDVHKTVTELTQATACYRAALHLQPDLPQPYVNLGEVLKEQGRVTEAIEMFQAGLERHPDLALLRSNLLLALHYSPHVPPEVIWRAHRHWDATHARPLLPTTLSFNNNRNPERRLRIGYVSPDFCAHPVACFLLPLLQAHDRSVVEIFCYSNARRRDVVAERFQSLAEHWRMLVGMGDAEAAARIKEDGIDILVDLAGHTAGGRQLVFARKPAPVQVTWLGYPDTSGMMAMDYRLTDDIADPPGTTDGWHSEKLVRLPRGFLAYQPMVAADALADPPVLQKGFVTFGSFNNSAKVTPEMVRLWARLLHRVPTSRLVIKSRALADADTRSHYASLFAGHGITPDRIVLQSFIDNMEDHLRAYDQVDIALDCYPYNGTTTSCEALWMGVPIITLPGRHHVSRVTASLLSRCGLSDLIATDAADYIERAAGLAADLPRLTGLRQTLRQRMLSSPLTDHAGFARQIEETYRTMWRDWTADRHAQKLAKSGETNRPAPVPDIGANSA
jgi:protein O-GlcNAc transferase